MVFLKAEEVTSPSVKTIRFVHENDPTLIAMGVKSWFILEPNMSQKHRVG